MLRTGELRFGAAAEITHAAELFRSGNRESLGAGFGGTLSAQRFAPLRTFSAELETFFDASPGPGPDLSEVTLGELSPEFASSTRFIPLALAIGVLPRVEIAGSIALYRNERLLRRAALAGGNLGLNPATDANAAIAGRLGPSGAALGGGLLLPIATSPLGLELQRRVLAATGQELLLPEAPIDVRELLSKFAVEPLTYSVGGWGVGDAELRARVQLLNSLGGSHYPQGGRIGSRLAGYLGVRLPTGTAGDSMRALTIGPESGFAGIQGGGAFDLFYGEAFWGTAALDWERLSASQRSEWPPFSAAGPIIGRQPLPLTRTAGQRFEFSVIPRIRMTSDISLGGILRFESQGAGVARIADQSYEIGGGARTSVGFSVRYSTVSAAEGGRPILPLEVAAGYTGAVAGSGGFAAARKAFLQIALQPRLWGASTPTPEPPAEPTP